MMQLIRNLLVGFDEGFPIKTIQAYKITARLRKAYVGRADRDRFSLYLKSSAEITRRIFTLSLVLSSLIWG